MANGYKGLFKCEPKQTVPKHIQVENQSGERSLLEVGAYETSGLKPDWWLLPWESDYDRS